MSEQPMLNPRVLKVAVVVMGLLLVLGFGVVIVTVVLRAGRPAPEAGAAGPRDVAVALAPGGRVDHIVLEGSRIALDLVDETGRRIVVVDLNKGRATDVVRLGPAAIRAPAPAAP